ncbi:MAG TPA: 30S ribosomal protein S6 [Stellaceae bacterium]|jgi:small subunit ribosomal protein S6|nr:30S ribosomal protein S6 [Stellaceae bacterium]
MSFYETVFIARQDISGTQVDALADQFAAIVAEQGGEVKKRESWGLRNLAFRMKKNRKGHYVLFNIDGPGAAIAEMERNMRISEDILRYLTVRVEALEEGPSAVLQNRGRGDERDRDRDRGGYGGDRDRGFGGDRGPRRDREPRDAEPPVPPAVASEGAE